MRKLALLAVGMVLSPIFGLAVAPGIASAIPIYHGTVTCDFANGAWGGVVKFSPPLRNGGVSTHEVVTLKAGFAGSSTGTTGGCLTSMTPPPGNVVGGAIAGKMKFVGAGSNNCSTLFPSTLAPSIAAFKIKWLVPHGAPTLWTSPTSVAFSTAAITISGGAVAGSFAPYATPTATLADPSWPGLAGAIATGCATSAGLSGLTITSPSVNSTGTW